MGKIRIPICGFVHFSDEERMVINSSYFQRLRNIKQLSLTSYVYPGATHSRFEHSIGVMEVADRMFCSLLSKSECKDKVERSLKAIGIDIESARQLLRLAALMHDTGHLPFSHGAENILPTGKKHEDVSLAVILSQHEVLSKLYSVEVINAINQIIGSKPIIPELRLLRNVISGSIDADRTDYLIRDSHHCGVDYGIFDSKRLIESLTVVEGYAGGLELSIDAEGVHALEALVMARYYMFTQVYYHKTRRIYDYYIRCYLKKWETAFAENLLNVLSEDDITIWQNLRSDACEDSECGSYARRILYRNNHSVLLSSTDFADKIDIRKTLTVQEKMASNYEDLDFWVDKGSGKIHDFFSEGEEEGEELRITKGSKEALLTKYSRIIQKIPKKFQICRLYAAQKDGEGRLEKDRLDKLKDEAMEIERGTG